MNIIINNKYSQFHVMFFVVHPSFNNNSSFSLMLLLYLTSVIFIPVIQTFGISVAYFFDSFNIIFFFTVGKQTTKERNACIHPYRLLKIISLKTSEKFQRWTLDLANLVEIFSKFEVDHLGLREIYKQLILKNNYLLLKQN